MKDKKLSKIYSNNWFIIKTAAKVSPLYVAMCVINPFFQAILIFVQHILLLQLVLDCIQYNKPFSSAFYYIVGVFLFAVFKMLMEDIYDKFYKRKAEEKLQRHMKYMVYEKAVSMDIECYDNPEYYNDFVWAMNEAAGRIQRVVHTIGGLTWYVTTIFVTGVFVIATDMSGLVFVALSFVLNFFGNKRLNKLHYDRDIDIMPKYRKRDYVNRVFYLKDYIKELRLINLKEKLYEDYDAGNEDIKESIASHSKKITRMSFAVNYFFNIFLINGLYVLYILFLASQGIISGGSLVALFLSSRRLNGGLSGLSSMLPRFSQNSLYIEKIKTFLNRVVSIKEPDDSSLDIKKIPESASDLHLKNIDFTYSGNKEPTLKNISISIKSGEKVAIVGHNGAGKTTLINLLLRLYDPTGGSVEYGGTNIKDFGVGEYRSMFGVAFQDFQIFAATIAENIKMDTGEVDEAGFERAVKKSGFYDKLAALSEGKATILTREFGEGVELSGGEAQKLALSRIFYKDSRFIIMDEPSSALDPISEAHLNQTIINESGGKTIIFISHRLSTTRIADKIYYMENGEITESGSHNQLMTLGGRYAYMFNLQAENYKKGVKVIV